jgi:glycerol uptake facilitator-like aquaporin
MRRALLAEGLGSMLLAATVIGSGIMAEQLAGGNLAVALIANTGATIARSLSDTFAGIAPAHVPAFIASQLGGALVGLLLAKYLLIGPSKGPISAR